MIQRVSPGPEWLPGGRANGMKGAPHFHASL